MSEHRVLIVGGGAAGVLLAVALLEAAAATGADPVAVTLVERRAEVGPGLAYSTTDSRHLLNNTAGCMSGVSGDPDHFVRWLRARGHDAGGDAYVPRRWYGDYLTDLLAAAHVPDGSGLEVVHGEAIDLVEHAAGVTLALGDGRTLHAHRAVLAVGNPPPPRRTTDLADVVVNDPWAPDALDGIGPASRVLLVGTGLTMVDVALTLAQGESAPAMTAASRHGLLPRRHRQVPVRPRPVGLPAAVTLPDLLAGVRRAVARAEEDGADWRAVVDGMRPRLQGIWQALGEDDRRRFLRHVARRWEVVRHRMAPGVADRLDVLRAAGTLTVTTTGELAASGERPSFTHVVNCTGPQPVSAPGWSMLVDQLVHRGTARPDALGLGLDTAPDGALLSETGRASDRVFALGYARRGTAWECTAVPEIRAHADALAALLSSLGARVAA